MVLLIYQTVRTDDTRYKRHLSDSVNMAAWTPLTWGKNGIDTVSKAKELGTRLDPLPRIKNEPF